MAPSSKLLVLSTLLLFAFFLDIGEGLVKTIDTRVDHKPGDNDPAQPTEEEEVETSITLLLVVCLLIVCFVSAYLLQQVQPQVKFIHETGVAIVLGAVIGAFIRFFTHVDRLEKAVKFDDQLFFLFLLPPIIFESGYFIKKTNFFSNFWSISTFAFIGTGISAFVFGGLLYVFTTLLGLAHNLSLVECFVFGSLISATDPVTVLAIFKELKVEKNLHANVFGESIFNDAVAIVLFRVTSSFLVKPFSWEDMGLATLEFLVTFGGSVIIGVVIAGICSLLFKYTEMYRFQKLEGILILLYAYASYLLAEGLRLSGIVAILFNGVTMAHYNYYNLSRQSQESTKIIVQTIASICEMFVFAYLGLALFSLKQSYDIVLIIASVLCCLISRAFNIVPLSFIINVIRGKKSDKLIPYSHQVVLWFAGLRGAIAFALSLSLPNTGGQFIHTTTLVIVLITCLLFGGSTGPLLIKLNLATRNMEADVEKEEEEEEEQSYNPNSCWNRFERKYVKAFFIRKTADIRGSENAIELGSLRGSREMDSTQLHSQRVPGVLMSEEEEYEGEDGEEKELENGGTY